MKTIKELAEKYNVKIEFISETKEGYNCCGMALGNDEFIFAVAPEGLESEEDKKKFMIPMFNSYLKCCLLKGQQIVDRKEEVFCEPGNPYYGLHHFLANHSKTYIPFGV